VHVRELPNHARLRPHRLPPREVPHLVIEPNSTCNIECVRCYKDDRSVVKTFEEVRAEIDRGLELRNLESISLAGGEPTLHPRLADIVRHVKGRGLLCLLVTNGIRFDEPGGPALLDELVDAGIDRVLVHVDEGQRHARGDIEAVRRRVFELLESRRIFFALSITLPAGGEAELAHSMRRYAGFRWFDGSLSTLGADVDDVLEPTAERGDEATLQAVQRAMWERLGLVPTTYVPTSLDPDRVSWLIYLYYLNTRTGRTFAVSPEFSRLLRRVMRRLTGRQPFATTTSPRWFLPALAMTGLAEAALRPTRLRALARLVRGSGAGRDLRFQYVIVQRAPRLDPAAGELEICWQCPDATIRKGRLLPVCIADRLDPLDPNAPVDERAAPLRRGVERHLQGD